MLCTHITGCYAHTLRVVMHTHHGMLETRIISRSPQYVVTPRPRIAPFCCLSNCGPSVNGLGCNENISLDYIFHSYEDIDICFENGSEVLPSSSEEKKYKVKETEIFQVIIE